MTDDPRRAQPLPPDSHADPDGGFTLIELLVAMGLFSIMLVVLVAAVVTWSSTTVRTVRAADLSEQSDVVYGSFDRSVPSASEINRPVQIAGSWYVEILDSSYLPKRCTQWALRPDGRLQVRYWTETGTPAPAPPWVTQGSGLTANAGAQPFTMTPAAGNTEHESLTVALTARSGSNSPSVATQGTFVARNSSVDSVTDKDSDSDGRSDTEVCTNDFSDLPGGRA